MPRVAFDRRMPGGNGPGVLSLVRANAPEQVMGVGERRVVREPCACDRGRRFELAALAQALAQFEKGESLGT